MAVQSECDVISHFSMD